MDSNPSPKKIPSAAVGIFGQVPSNSLPFMPARNGVCCFGSHRSVCAMPPGSQIKIMASAFGVSGVFAAAVSSAELAAQGMSPAVAAAATVLL